jgi:hypothetical protein
MNGTFLSAITAIYQGFKQQQCYKQDRGANVSDYNYCTIVTTSGIHEVDLKRIEVASANGTTASGQADKSDANQNGSSRWNQFLEKARQDHPNAFRRWTREVDQELVRQFGAGITLSELASVFQRSERAVWMRLQKLGCFGKTPAECTL